MLKAMLVDDEYDIREGLKDLIDWEKEGFMVASVATDGMDALEKLEADHPDLVVTDIKMPRMDGLELSRQIKERYPQTRIILLSGFNEFMYAKQAMRYGVSNYLLKPVDTDELQKEVAAAQIEILEYFYAERNQQLLREELKQYFLKRLVTGEIPEPMLIKEAEKHNLQLKAESFVVAIVDISSEKDEEVALSIDDIQNRAFSVKNVIANTLQSVNHSELFDIPNGRFCILFWGSYTEWRCPEKIKHLMRGMKENVNRSTEQNIWIGLSDTVDLLSDVHKAFLQAQKALKMKFYSTEEFVFSYPEMYPDSDIWNLNWKNDILLNGIKIRNLEGIAHEIEQLFCEVERMHLSTDMVEKVIILILIQLYQLCTEQGMDWKETFEIPSRKLIQLVQWGSIKKLQSSLIDLCIQIAKINDDAHIDYDPISNDILCYIRGHFTEGLNLVKLSEVFFLNPYYIGKLIKKKQNLNFNEYMNKLRIEEAMKLLCNTTLSINEISEKVGYKYINHFYKYFKQATGFSPGEYRKKNFNHWIGS